MNLKEQLFALSAAAGPSGKEDEAARLGAAFLSPLVDRLDCDPLGNIMGWRFSDRENARTLLIDAHLDEVSLIVTGQDEGYLRFIPCNGAVDPRILPGLRVRILAETPIEGIITCLPPHVLSAEERERPFSVDILRIDTGLTPEEAERLAPIGTRIVYGTKPFSMGEHRVCGKSLDNRACFAMLLRTAELLAGQDLPVNVCFTGSVQEESGLTGIKTAAYTAAPDFALVTDATFGSTPDSPKADTFPLNCGPVIGIGPILHRRLTEQLMVCARRLQIPFEREFSARNTGTNAMQTQISRMGVPTMQISVPLRYMHTPLEVIDLRDLEQSARLIAEFVLSAGEGAML